MTPKEYYQKELNEGRIQPDDRQRPIVEKLEIIFQELTAREKNKNWFSQFRKKNPVKGLYLWGSVGIGKTFLMDCFYHCLSIPKLRLHFHQFMLKTHEALNAIQGEKNPLEIIAKKISLESSVICFDEFFVSNIADAMILGELFLHLFKNGVTLVTSSNVPPDLLYKDGIQRERFLPAIELIKQNTDVIHLHSKMDYRQQHLKQSGVYYTPLNTIAEKEMQNAFIHFSQGAAVFYDPIRIYERDIAIVKQAGSVIWFDFEVICGRPRSQNDYLELAKNYHTVMVQNLRQIQPNENDLILSFIYLVDILYDAHCRLVISSAVPVNEIYLNEKTQQPFQRTLSRLIEMQSTDYVYSESSDNTLTHL
jgi:cell division protein ZapE